jgi:hypothetical protein
MTGAHPLHGVPGMCAPKLSAAMEQCQAEVAPRTRVYGDWLLLYGATSLMTSVILNAPETNFGAVVTWRTADVRTEQPNAWQTAFPATPAAAYDTNGALYPHTFDVSAAAASAMFVQAAVSPVLKSGTAVKESLVRLWASVNSKGFVVARQRIDLQSGLGTDTAVFPSGARSRVSGSTA